MEIAGQRMQHALERAVIDPALKPTMTGLIRRIPVGQILPRGARPEDPEDAIEHVARIAPRATATVAAHPRLGQERRENRPLGVGEVHTWRYDGPQNFVSPLASGL